MSQPYAVITGASSGIGFEIAELFAKDGVHLILIARQQDVLHQMADRFREKYNIQVIVMRCDLSRVEEALEVYQQVKKLRLHVQYLVNSAGFGDFGYFIETDWKKENEMINLNISTLTYFTKVFAQDMVKHGKGKILNLGSTASFLPGPLMAVYFATKGYVLQLCVALAEELKGTGVTITTLCPGPTESGFQATAHMSESKIVRGKNLPSSKEVAEFGYKAMMAGKTTAIHGRRNAFFVMLSRILPMSVVAQMVRKAQA
jgi:uncharacterized protein